MSAFNQMSIREIVYESNTNPNDVVLVDYKASVSPPRQEKI